MSEVSEMPRADQLVSLRKHIMNLPEADRPFAQSLLNQHQTKGSLSDKQWYWVGKMTEAAIKPLPTTKLVDVGSRAQLDALFDVASQRLKFPSFVLLADHVGEVGFYRCSASAKKPNSIAISYGSDQRAGWITDVGFEWNDGVNEVAGLVDFLKVVLSDPVTAVKEYGALTGKCSFCKSPLTDERSTAAGYGPGCAKKWGLPYGKTQVKPLVCTAA